MTELGDMCLLTESSQDISEVGTRIMPLDERVA